MTHVRVRMPPAAGPTTPAEGDVRDAPGHISRKDPLADLLPQIQTQPPSRWEGRLKGEHGTAARADFTFIATLAFAANLIEGQGQSPEFPFDCDEASRALTLTGEQQGGDVRLQLQFDRHRYFKSRPFLLDGAIDVEERLIRGRWTYRCEPACGCGGSGGWFEMRRVD